MEKTAHVQARAGPARLFCLKPDRGYLKLCWPMFILCCTLSVCYTSILRSEVLYRLHAVFCHHWTEGRDRRAMGSVTMHHDEWRVYILGTKHSTGKLTKSFCTFSRNKESSGECHLEGKIL